MKDLAEFYGYLHKKNRGVFYRAETGGLGAFALGDGKYLTWDRDAAKAFARIACRRQGKPEKMCKVDSYKLPSDLKLLDSASRTFGRIKGELGFEPWDKPETPTAARIITHEVKKLGYDGVLSDDKFDGLVIYDEAKMKRVNKV